MASFRSIVEGLASELQDLGMLGDEPIRRKPMDDQLSGDKVVRGLPKKKPLDKKEIKTYWDDISKGWVPGGEEQKF